MLQIVHIENDEISESNSDSKLITFTVNDRVDKIIVNIRFNHSFNDALLNEVLNWIKITKDEVDITSKFSLHFPSNRYLQCAIEIQPSYHSRNALTSSKGSYALTIDRPSSNTNSLKYKATVLVDDRNLNMNYGVKIIRRGTQEVYKPYARLSWRGRIIDNAKIQMKIRPPGQQMNTVLGNNVKRQKPLPNLTHYNYNRKLQIARNKGLLALLPVSYSKTNLRDLPHVAEGYYETNYTPSKVGVYKIEFYIHAYIQELEETVHRIGLKTFNVSHAATGTDSLNLKRFDSRFNKTIKKQLRFKLWNKT